MSGGRTDWALDGLDRLIKTLFWLTLPLLSLGVLAFVPAAQAWFWTRSKGWLTIALALLLGGIAIVLMVAFGDGESPVPGVVSIAVMAGGLVSALFARPIALPAERRRRATGFAADEDEEPAVNSVLRRRHRRTTARGLAERDPTLALEVGVGRPDDPNVHYDDGGLVDLNNVNADGLVAALGWPRDQAEAFVRERDLRRGYESLTEVGAFSSVDPVLLDHHADRLVVLPWRPR